MHMKNAGTLHVSLPSDREIQMTRVFDAPRSMVFDALTTPALMKRWFGVVAGWSLDVCDVDLRPGGTFRYVWRGPAGEEMGMRGEFLEVKRPERLSSTEKFDHAWYEGSAVGTIVLTETAGKTTLTMTVRYDSRAVRDAVLKSPMEHGVAAGYNKLADVLRELSTTN
jgi:uncharacterized protein YndB with AHSA1/START domain